MSKIQQYAKFIVAIIGAAVAAGAGLIPVEWNGYLQLIAGVLTAVGVYAWPNKTAA